MHDMRAVRFHRIGSPNVLVCEDAPDPVPRSNEIRVRVRAAGINYADVHFRKGEYFIKPSLPDIPGLEAAGEIDAIGEGVTGFAIGDRVMVTGPHSYAELMVLPAVRAYPIPGSLSWEMAASLPVQGLTAMHVLAWRARFQKGEKVLVHAAAGGVGSLAVQIARNMGASLVIGTSSSEKLGTLKELGVDVAIDRKAGDFLQAVKRAAPSGVDVILEMSGGTDAYKRNLACLAHGGRMVVYGAASGDVRGTVEPIGLMAKNLSVMGYYLTALIDRREMCAPVIEQLIADVESSRVRVLRGPTFPLDQAAEAHRVLESGSSIGKLVLLT
jgi:NADPH2:quinone reductase